MLWRKKGVYIYTALLWLKLYLVQRILFDFSFRSWADEIAMVFGALSSAVLLSVLTIIIARKRTHLGFLVSSLLSTVLVLSNVLYYRYFHDFITIPVLMQSSNVSTIEHSVIHIFQFPQDLLIAVDTLVIAGIMLLRHSRFAAAAIPRTAGALLLTLAVCLAVNWSTTHSSAEEPSSRLIDRRDVVKNAGLVNYQIYDLAAYVQSNAKKWFVEEEDLEQVEKRVDELTGEESPLFRGMAGGKNVIFVSMESVQSFVLEREFGGREVTPFLNDLIRDSIYYTDFYQQTGQGKTSDAEFMVETSLYALPSGAVFFTHADNTYQSLAKSLEAEGYTTAVFHANDATFWNRDQMYEALGYDRFYDVTSFEVTAENTIGWGLNDIDFFAQSMEYVRELPRPFMAKWITLTNHHPFHLDRYEDWKARIPTHDETVRNYLATVRYTDEALERFFASMKEEGLYEDSIFILYGDHYGLSPEHYEGLESLLGTEIGPAEHIKLQRVPLIIHIPGYGGHRDDKAAGHVDIKPTVQHLLGIEDEGEIAFGTSLIGAGRPSFAVLRDGSFVAGDYIYTEDACYEKQSGKETDMEACKPYLEIARTHLNLSDEIIYGDLLRFAADGGPARRP